MTIERRDNFGESREKGISLFDAIRGKRTVTTVYPNHVIWTDGRITPRFTTVSAKDQEKFSDGLLVNDQNTVVRLASPGTRTMIEQYTNLRKSEINVYAKTNPGYRVRWNPSRVG